jgi:putative colanic acid biosynthesis acetyltransferase WcaF
MANYTVQDLSRFVVPDDFRGRPGWFVQLWWIVQALLFQTSPQIFYGWRRFLLRCFGAKIGKGVIIRPSVRVTYPWKLSVGDYAWIGDHAELYNLATIYIGHCAVVSQGCYLCTGTHDYEDVTFAISAHPIEIKDEAWVAAHVFIKPGVTVGHGAVVGARSLVTRDVGDLAVVAGSPAKFIKFRGEK